MLAVATRLVAGSLGPLHPYGGVSRSSYVPVKLTTVPMSSSRSAALLASVGWAVRWGRMTVSKAAPVVSAFAFHCSGKDGGDQVRVPRSLPPLLYQLARLPGTSPFLLLFLCPFPTFVITIASITSSRRLPCCFVRLHPPADSLPPIRGQHISRPIRFVRRAQTGAGVSYPLDLRLDVVALEAEQTTSHARHHPRILGRTGP